METPAPQVRACGVEDGARSRARWRRSGVGGVPPVEPHGTRHLAATPIMMRRVVRRLVEPLAPDHRPRDHQKRAGGEKPLSVRENARPATTHDGTASREAAACQGAAGNTTASLMGRTYPGAGSTIAPAVVFGYRGRCTLLLGNQLPDQVSCGKNIRKPVHLDEAVTGFTSSRTCWSLDARRHPMANLEAPGRGTDAASGMYVLGPGTLAAAAIAVCLAQVALAIPAVLNGLFQTDLATSSSQLTWISDAFLVPVCLLELSFGVLGDLFGRKRLLVGGALVLAAGEAIAVLTPGAGSSTGTRVLVLWTGQIIAGIGAAALLPTSLAMVASGTHTTRNRARSVSVWAAALSAGGVVSPVLGGLVAKLSFGSDPEAGWRWAFLVVLALALISAAVSLAVAKDSSAPAGRSLDWPGQVTIAIALFALLYAVIQGPTTGWGSGQVIAGFIIAAVFAVLFILAERRSAAPLLRLDLFANRAFAV